MAVSYTHLMTNDGGLVNKINRFGNNHEKEYIVKVNKHLTNTFVDGMSKGVPILDTVSYTHLFISEHPHVFDSFHLLREYFY